VKTESQSDSPQPSLSPSGERAWGEGDVERPRCRDARMPGCRDAVRSRCQDAVRSECRDAESRDAGMPQPERHDAGYQVEPPKPKSDPRPTGICLTEHAILVLTSNCNESLGVAGSRARLSPLKEVISLVQSSLEARAFTGGGGKPL